MPDEQRNMWTGLAERDTLEVAPSKFRAYPTPELHRGSCRYRCRIMDVSPGVETERGLETRADAHSPRYLVKERSSRWTPGMSLLEL